MIGSAIAHYDITRKLGSGGMGEVYLAHDTKLDREVALKLLPVELASSAERRQRFEREARAAAKVTHPNIATIYEVGECDERLYIAMEYVRGQSLRQRLDDPVGLDEALRIGAEIARGLAKAHSADVIHRDLKPDNVMLDEDGRVRLLDFGLAKLRELDAAVAPAGTLGEQTPTETAALTRQGQVLGTPGYMSPEQAAGKAVDHRGDIFSLGTILYEMLTAKRAFVGDSFMEVAASTMRDEPDPASQHNPEVSEQLDALLARCLAKDAGSRLASAADLADALDAARGKSVSAVSVTRAEPGPEGARPVVKRRRWPRALWGLAALGIGLLLMWWYDRAPESTAPLASSASAAASGASAASSRGWMPLPTSTSEAALEAFRDGMRASREAVEAPAHFEKAVGLDPTLASAHLRLATWYFYEIELPLARKHFEQASKHKARLNEIETLWLDAVEPLVRRQPADHRESARRFDRALERFPNDPELLLHAGARIDRFDPKKAIARFTRAAEIDPDFTLALFSKAESEVYLGQFDDARRTIEACLSRPSLVCRLAAMRIHAQRGECQQVERHAREMIAAYPSSPLGYLRLAGALASQGQPPAALFEALNQSHSRLPGSGAWLEKQAGALKVGLTVLVNALWGRFDEAIKAAKQMDELIRDNPSQETHGRPAAALVGLYAETGRQALAADAAERFLAKRSAWEPNPRAEDFAVVDDVAPFMLQALRRDDRISHEQLTKRIQAWAKRWDERDLPERYRGYVWLAGYARVVTTPEEAAWALAALPDFEPLPHAYRRGLLEYAVGRTHYAAGQLDQARSWLERATRSCTALTSPLWHVQAHYWLGRVREQKGDKEAACQSYAFVLGRWGKAAPRSLTAEAALERVRALKCDVSP